MNWIPDRFSKKWVGRLVLHILVLTIVFSITIGIKIRGDVQMELLFKHFGLASLITVVTTLSGILGFKKTYLFTLLGMILGVGYLMFYYYTSSNGLAGIVGMMSFFEFIIIGFVIGVVVEIAMKVKEKMS